MTKPTVVQPPRPTWNITLTAPAGEPEGRSYQRLRHVLKYLWRTHGLKCVGIRAAEGAEFGDLDGESKTTMAGACDAARYGGGE